jgi:ribonucleotide monophosphatase NagD (HAD superfamily)
MFDEALRIMQAKAEETIFIGDSPTEDIKGAESVGIRTVFVASRFNTLEDLQKCGANPEWVVRDLKEICSVLPEVVKC